MKKFRCPVCGYIHEGDSAPEKCPICNAPADKFVEQGTPAQLYAECGYDEEAILEMISKMQEQR